MKIVLFTDQGAHYREPIFRQVSEEVPSGVEIFFYIPSNKRENFNISSDDIGIDNVVRFENFYLSRKCFVQWPAVKVALLKNCDLIILWGGINIVSNYLAIILAKITKKKVFLWGHGAYGDEKFFRKVLRMAMYIFADHQFTYGERGAEIVKQWLPRKKVTPIYNSLDFKRLNAIYLKLDDTRLKWDFIFVGRITKVKNLELLFQALRIAKRDEKEYSVIIVGSGENEAALKKLAVRFKIEKNIFWAGPCYDDIVLAKYFKQSRFCISPGNIGLMAMHAFYFRTPVITHGRMEKQMPEAEVVVHRKNGLFFEYENAEDLYKVMDHSTKVELSAYSDQAYESVRKRFTPLAQSNIFWSVIKDYLEKI